MFLQKVFCPDVTWLGWLDVNGQLSVCLSAAVISGNCIPGQADWFLMHSDTDAAQQSGICTPAEYKLQWPPAHRPKLLSQSGRPRGHASRWVARIGFALLFISDKETEQVKVCAFDITAPPLSRPPHSCVCTHTHAHPPPPPPPIDGCAHMLGPNQTRLHICRAANRYILAIVCYAQGRCTMLLHSWSYHYAVPQKNKNCLFSIPCIRVGIKLTSNRLCVCLFVSKILVVPQPIGVRVLTSWPIIVFGSIPTLMCHFLARRLLFSIISNRHAKASSWKWAPRWWISPQKTHTKISGKSTIQNNFCALYDQHRVPSMWSAATASSVLGGMYDTSAWSITSTKEKREEVRWRFPINFYGLWRNSSGDAFHKFLCSAQYRSLCSQSWHLFWCTFPQKRIAKEDHICMLCSKSNYYA